MDAEKLLSNKSFQQLLLKIFRTLETKESFEFTFEDAQTWSNLGNVGIQNLIEKPKLELDDFPDVIGEQTTGENIPENFPVNLPQPVIQKEIESFRAKPFFVVLKSESLESLVENVNKFNHSNGVNIISTSPIQKIDEDFIKEIVYYDFETIEKSQ